jgi:integrase
MQSLELFLSSIRSPETRDKYSIYFKKYQEFIGPDLFCDSNPRLIEQKIIEFLIDMKSKGKGYSTIHNYAAAVLAFYKINDAVLNVTKISKFIPVQKKVRKDRAYTFEEIGKLLEIADERIRAITLLLTSSGIRVGALPQLKLGHLEGAKLTVYENEKEEYFTFITPECQKTIDTYLDMRLRYGEKLDKDSFLIREQFDIKDPFQIARPRQLTTAMVNWKILDLLRRLGLKTKEVARSHGFRKFFTTQLINSKVNPEIREMLLGHKIGLASAYYRPTEEEMYSEYLKAVNNLTINEEHRLKQEVLELKEKQNEIELMKLKNERDMKNMRDEMEEKFRQIVLKIDAKRLS